MIRNSLMQLFQQRGILFFIKFIMNIWYVFSIFIYQKLHQQLRSSSGCSGELCPRSRMHSNDVIWQYSSLAVSRGGIVFGVWRKSVSVLEYTGVERATKQPQLSRCPYVLRTRSFIFFIYFTCIYYFCLCMK